MKPTLELQSCFTDNPDFRSSISSVEDSIFTLEHSVKQLIKFSRNSTDAAEGANILPLVTLSLQNTVKKTCKYPKISIDSRIRSRTSPFFVRTISTLRLTVAHCVWVETALGRFSETLMEVERMRLITVFLVSAAILISRQFVTRCVQLKQLSEVFVDPLDNFVKKDIHEIRVSDWIVGRIIAPFRISKNNSRKARMFTMLPWIDLWRGKRKIQH